MGLDIRLPIGALFSLLGLMIGGYGLWSDADVHAPWSGFNINLAWGIVLLAFGATMLALWRRSARRRLLAPRRP